MKSEIFNPGSGQCFIKSCQEHTIFFPLIERIWKNITIRIIALRCNILSYRWEDFWEHRAAA
jgi:hypothetical protein